MPSRCVDVDLLLSDAKFRTDVSALSASPQFTPNPVILDIPIELTTQELESLVVSAFVVPSYDENSNATDGAVMLGKATVQLTDYRGKVSVICG